MFWNLLPVKKYNNFTSKFRESQYFQIFHWGNYKHFSRGQMKNQQFFPLVWKSSKTNYHQSTFHNFSHWSFPLKTQQFLGKDLFSAKCLLDIIWLAELFHRLGVLTEWKGACGIHHLRWPLRPGSLLTVTGLYPTVFCVLVITTGLGFSV